MSLFSNIVFFNIVFLTSLCKETGAETLVYSILCNIQCINSLFLLFCEVILFAIIAVFMIQNEALRLHNERTMSMWKKPHRPTGIDLTLHKMFIGPYTIRYFLEVTGDPNGVSIIRTMLMQQGLFVLVQSPIQRLNSQGLLFSHGVMLDGGYGTMRINPIRYQMLRGQFRITSGGRDLTMINDRVQLLYLTDSNLQLITHRSNL